MELFEKTLKKYFKHPEIFVFLTKLYCSFDCEYDDPKSLP